MLFLAWFSSRVLIFVACSACTHAMYFMDDRNASIHYTGASWASYDYGTKPEYSWADDPRVFDRTLTHSNCTTVDDCHVKIPFTGVGITVYNVIRSSINLSMSLDGGSPSSFTFHDDLQCLNINLNMQGCYNYSTYTVQSLSYTTHLLDITLFSPSDLSHYPYSDYFLDYIAIDDANPYPNTTPASQTTATAPASQTTAKSNSTISPHRSHRTTVGAAVGGTIGGIVLVAALLWLFRNRRRRPVHSGWIVPHAKGSDDPEMRAASISPFPPTTERVDSRVSAAFDVPTLVGNQTIESRQPQVTVTLPSPQPPARNDSASPVLDSTGTESRLSPQQVEFVHDLYRMNIPAPAVADVMDRMLRGGGNADGRIAERPVSVSQESPPSYDKAV